MKKYLFLLTLLIIGMGVVGLLIGGCGQGNQAGSNGDAQIVATRTVSGEVTDLISGKAITGAIIYSGGKVGYTDSNGLYSLTGISPTADSVTTLVAGFPGITVYSSKESLNIEAIFEPVWPAGYSFKNNSLISGEVRDQNGNLVNSYLEVHLFHKYYQASEYSTNGVFNLEAFLDPEKLPLQVYLATANASYAGIKSLQLQTTGSIEVGTLEVNSNPASITGSVTFPCTQSYFYISWGVMEGNERLYSNYWGNYSSGLTYSVYLPPSTSSLKYYLRIYSFSSSGNAHTAKYAEGIDIASGEVKNINFTMPGYITCEAPVDHANSIGTTPLLSWLPPDPKFNLFLVYLYEGGGGSAIKWIGVTDQNSLIYPHYSSGSGLENLNLEPGREYFWQVRGYYIPGYSLKAGSVKLAGLNDSKNKGIGAFAEQKSAKIMTVTEVNQALEEIMTPNMFSFRP